MVVAVAGADQLPAALARMADLHGQGEAAELCGRREVPILEVARSAEFSLDKLKQALAKASEIH